MPRHPPDLDQVRRWMTFLRHHDDAIAAMDFFTVPTVCLRVLYGFFVIEHGRRHVLHFDATFDRAAWVVRQLREAFPYDTAPKHLIFDRDSIFSPVMLAFIRSMGAKPCRTSYRSPRLGASQISCEEGQAAFSDESVPNQSTEALAGAYGVSQIVVEGVTESARYATPSPPVAETSVTANVDTPAGKATAALYLWTGAGHDLLAEPKGRRQYKPGFPAFDRLKDDASLDNPVARVQAVVTEFLLGGRGPEGRARAVAP